MQKVKISDIKSNPNNPRLIKSQKFEKLVNSIKQFPQMLELRPIVVNNDMVVLGGNMRLKACKEAGLKEVPIIKASELTPEQEKEFIVKDNVGFGEWDWDILANEWDADEITDWGLDVWKNEENEENEENYTDKQQKDLSNDQSITYKIELSFNDESEQEKNYIKLTKEGYKCQILTL